MREGRKPVQAGRVFSVEGGLAKGHEGASRMGIGVGALRRLGVAAALVILATFGSVMVLVGTAGSVFAQSAPAGIRIDVEGNRRVETDTIRSYFNVGPNERLDAAKIDGALKALYATGLFQDVHITPAPGRILVTVVENPVINRVAFEGNHKAKDEQLATEVVHDYYYEAE